MGGVTDIPCRSVSSNISLNKDQLVELNVGIGSLWRHAKSPCRSVSSNKIPLVRMHSHDQTKIAALM